MTIQQIRSQFDKAQGRYEEIQREIKAKTEKTGSLEKRLEHIEQAQALIQVTAKETQENISLHIEDIVQMPMEACFPGEYDFCLDFEIKRGRTEAMMYLDDGQGNQQDPLEANGGGLVDIIGFALRLACWSLGTSAPVMILDEPFKYLSEDLRPLAGEILRKLSQKLGIQIIMITHDPVMVDISDRVFEVTQTKGVSHVLSND